MFRKRTKRKNARCGRCGLWSNYPSNHREKKYAGVCLWYQLRLDRDSVFEARSCDEFFERIPEMTAVDHFKYKVQRDNLGDAYQASMRAKRLAYVGLCLSILGLALKLF